MVAQCVDIDVGYKQESKNISALQQPMRLNRRWVLMLLGAGILSVVILLLIGGGRAPLETMRHANWRFLGMGLIVHYSGFAVRGWRWQRILGSMGHRLTYSYCTGLLMSGWFVSAIVPARAGDLLRIGILRKPNLWGRKLDPIPIADGMSSVILERLLDMTAIIVMGAVSGILIVQSRLPQWVLPLYGTGLVILSVIGIMLLVSAPVLNWLRRWSDHHFWHDAIDLAEQTASQIALLWTMPSTAIVTFIQSVYIWFCDALLLWLVVSSLNTPLTLGSATFVALTVDVVAAVPITPGGVGQIEAAYAALLALLSMPFVNLSATILLTRLISYWSFLIICGLIAFFLGVGQLIPNSATFEHPNAAG